MTAVAVEIRRASLGAIKFHAMRTRRDWFLTTLMVCQFVKKGKNMYGINPDTI